MLLLAVLGASAFFLGKGGIMLGLTGQTFDGFVDYWNKQAKAASLPSINTLQSMTAQLADDSVIYMHS